MIHLVSVGEVDRVWPLIAQGMDRGCRKARSFLSEADLHRACRMGQYSLHVATKGGNITGAVVVNVYPSPWGRTLEVIALTGHDLSGWARDLYEYPWLKQTGIQRVIAEGRPGLGRLLAKYVPIRVVRHTYEMVL